MSKYLFIIITFVLSSFQIQAKTVRYDLNIEKQPVNITGKSVDFALSVNGGIPGPILEFTEGDEAEITVYNRLEHEEVSIHWHGLLLPPEEDGVAYVNTPPIHAGRSRTFNFKIRQHGTFWYHSHTGVQEQKGVYGAFIIHPKKELIASDKEVVVVLSDWSDENPDQIMRNLRKDGDYYLYKKKSVRSIFGALQEGQAKTYFQNEWERMGGMDLSDIGYDAFLMNGKNNAQLLMAHPGERIRIRIINAGASSYFYVSLGEIPMQVVSADGVDIEPLRARQLLMGMAETYDVLFTVPEHKNYELRATAQDMTGFTSGWIGMGPKESVPHKNTSQKSQEEHLVHHAHAGHTVKVSSDLHSAVIPTLTVDEIKAKAPTTLPAGAPLYDLKLVLSGDMERYVWHINGKAIHEDRNILIREGDRVRFTFVNDTMMHHPMHLHGHFFRVLNRFGEKSPLKHTVDVPPHGSRIIEFYANEPGQWMLHCHNLYHMKTGMARVVKYMSYEPRPEMAKLDRLDPHLHDHWYKSGSLLAATNQGEADFKFTQTWNSIEGHLESRQDENWEVEGDLFYRRWFDKYLSAVMGGSVVHGDSRGQLGVGYILPLLIESQVLIDHKGQLRIDLEKSFQWTSTLLSEVEYTWRQDTDLDSEYRLSLMYKPSWAWAAGLQYTGHSAGIGLQYQF